MRPWASNHDDAVAHGVQYGRHLVALGREVVNDVAEGVRHAVDGHREVARLTGGGHLSPMLQFANGDAAGGARYPSERSARHVRENVRHDEQQPNGDAARGRQRHADALLGGKGGIRHEAKQAQGSPEGGEGGQHRKHQNDAPVEPARHFHPWNRYPTPRMVIMRWGLPGSASNFWRIQRMWTSTVRVSPM